MCGERDWGCERTKKVLATIRHKHLCVCVCDKNLCVYVFLHVNHSSQTHTHTHTCVCVCMLPLVQANLACLEDVDEKSVARARPYVCPHVFLYVIQKSQLALEFLGKYQGCASLSNACQVRMYMYVDMYACMCVCIMCVCA
jgi:hypothetical protein